MRKNTNSTKKRIAEAKRGLKRFIRAKKSKSQKHLRTEKRMQQRIFRERKLKELIDKLSGANKESAG